MNRALSHAAALVLALALASSARAQVAGLCGAGRNCRATSFIATNPTLYSSSLAIPTNTYLCWGGSSCAASARWSGDTLFIGAESAVPVTLTGAQFSTTSTNISGTTGLTIASTTLTTGLAAPTADAIAGESTSGRLYLSDGSRWTQLGGGMHPVTQGPTFFYVMDRTAGANAPAWAVAPRAGAASVAFTTVGTLTSGTTGTRLEPYLTISSTAVSGNQAHHSTAAFVGSAARWSARVGIDSGGFTTMRAFFGLSATLPLTAGSSTPTASAAVFRADTTVGANWYACTGNAAALTCTDTGVAVSAGDIVASLEVDCREQDVNGDTSACTFWINGRARVRLTTNLPPGGVALGSTVSVETLAAATRTVSLGTAVSIEPGTRAP